MHQFIILLVFLFLTTTVIGCGPLPKPFKRDYAADQNPLIKLPNENDIAVNTVTGTPIPMGRALSRSVAKEITKYNLISYVGDRGSSKYVLHGRIEGWRGGRTMAPPLRLHWILQRRDGKIVRTYVYEVFGTIFEWNYESKKTIKNIGENTAHAVVEQILGKDSKSENDTTLPNVIWIREVQNAPGDGNIALTSAIKYALTNVGVSIARNRAKANQILICKVRIGELNLKKQNIEILWILETSKGKEIGRARQRNRMAAATLNGRWGKTALKISMAVAEAIKKLSENEGKNIVNNVH